MRETHLTRAAYGGIAGLLLRLACRVAPGRSGVQARHEGVRIELGEREVEGQVTAGKTGRRLSKL